MRGLFASMKYGGYGVDISTFSKASKHRSLQPFKKIYCQLNQMVRIAKPSQTREIVPIDGTIISLTSNLLWKLGYHQVKLLAGANLSSGNILTEFLNLLDGGRALQISPHQKSKENGRFLYC